MFLFIVLNNGKGFSHDWNLLYDIYGLKYVSSSCYIFHLYMLALDATAFIICLSFCYEKPLGPLCKGRAS